MSNFEAALEHHQSGRLQEAALAYRQILEADPSHSASLANLGVLYLQQGIPGSAVFNEGLHCLEQSLRSNPNQPFVHNNLGNAYMATGDFAKSDEHYLSAIESAPSYVDAYINRSLLLKQNKGVHTAKEWLRGYEAQFQNDAAFFMCLGALQLDSGAFSDSLFSFDKVILHNPGSAAAWYNRGNAQRMLRRNDEALSSYRMALRIDPNFAEAHTNMGVLNQDLKRFDQAVTCYDAALSINPNAINATYNRAVALENMGRFGEAIAGYERTLILAPAHPYLKGREHYARMQMCDWARYDERVFSICDAVAHGIKTSVPFPFLAVADDLALQQQCASIFVSDMFPAKQNKFTPCMADKRDRIRVGYFSPDFRTHAVGFLTAGLFESHDRNEFEVFVISLGTASDDDSYAQRIANGCEHFVDASSMTDSEVVTLARSLGLDIAIDLAGHTMDARTDIFAQRVAPLQVNYLGYPGSMGAPYMDVILGDDVVIPYGQEFGYTERVVRLPKTFQINDDKRVIGHSHDRAYYGLPESVIVFASFNTSYKVTPSLFAIWCRILLESPRSVLWLLGECADQIHNLRTQANNYGVGSDRLVFANRVGYAEHLARYSHVDLVLDTVPFNGGTSTSDALWGGAPVLTCLGGSFASRMSGSLLRAVGLESLVAKSLEEYEQLGCDLAKDLGGLSDLKRGLKNSRSDAPLFDTLERTRDIERVYKELVRG